MSTLKNSCRIVSVSGGLSSAATLLRCYELYPEDTIYPVFADTHWEDEDVYRFINDLVYLTGCRLVRLSVGKTPADVSEDQHMIFNSRVAKCTQVLKTQPILEYAKTLKAPDTRVYMCIGFNIGDRYDKTRGGKPYGRLPAPVHNWQKEGIYVKYPLWYYPRITNVRAYVESYGLTVPNIYNKREEGYNITANCGGGCFKAGKKHWRGLLQINRERFLERALWENDMRKRPQYSNYAILTKTENGIKRPYPLLELMQDYDTATASERRIEDMLDDMESSCVVECQVF